MIRWRRHVLINGRSAGKEWNRPDGRRPQRPLFRPDVTIPWATDFYLFKKLMPVLIYKAPELLKRLERRRKIPSQAENDHDEPSLAILQKRLHAHVQTLATQMEAIKKLEATVRATKRSLKIAWLILVATIILCLSIFVLLLSRS